MQPVKLTPIEKWIAKGKNKQYCVKRLKISDQILNKKNIDKLKLEGKKFLGKNYDISFEWNDEAIYCSELIWKIYKRALGIEIGKPQHLEDFDLSNPLVKQIRLVRYGSRIPMMETVISPAVIYEYPELQTICFNE